MKNVVEMSRFLWNSSKIFVIQTRHCFLKQNIFNGIKINRNIHTITPHKRNWHFRAFSQHRLFKTAVLFRTSQICPIITNLFKRQTPNLGTSRTYITHYTHNNSKSTFAFPFRRSYVLSFHWLITSPAIMTIGAHCCLCTRTPRSMYTNTALFISRYSKKLWLP